MKRKRLIILLVLLVLAVTAFIFSNSLKGAEASNRDSDSIIALIQPLVERLFGQGAADHLNYAVRKSAHVVEFALLGVLVSCLVLALKKSLRGYEFFYALAVAVVDEFIQSFTGRTSQIKDVLIDFSGALLGFGIVFLITKLQKRKKNGT
ncbi:MAG: VanZ family protein [Clostridia bacterium]|nr:VanZ family protein [Clostridia bacterium]